MSGVIVIIALYTVGATLALFLIAVFCYIWRQLSKRYMRRQISIMRDHPFNQPATSGLCAPSNDPDNPNPFARYGGTYNAECDRLTAILEDRSWMGLKKDVWVIKDLAHRLYCFAVRIMRGFAERVRLLRRLMTPGRRARREAQMWPGPLGDGGENGTQKGGIVQTLSS